MKKKITDIQMATGKLLGRTSASTGSVEEITVSGGLSFSGSALSVDSYSVSGSEIIVTKSIIPSTDGTLSLGKADKKWADIFVSANTIHLGNATQLSGTSIIVDAGGSANQLADIPTVQASKLVAKPYTYNPGAGPITVRPSIEFQVGANSYPISFNTETLEFSLDAAGNYGTGSLVGKKITLSNGTSTALDLTGNIAHDGNYTSTQTDHLFRWDGNTTFGYDGSNTTTLKGTTTVQGPFITQGATTLGDGNDTVTVNAGANNFVVSASNISVAANGNVAIAGNLTVSGTTTTINSNQVDIGDAILLLNSDIGAGASPTEDAGIQVARGSEAAAKWLWDEATDAWTPKGGDIKNVGTVAATTFTGALTGNASSASALATARNFSISGGGITAAAASFDGTANLTLSASVDAGHITLARMANLAANTIIGNNTGSPATPIALSSTQVTAMLNAFSAAASDSAGVKGLVPQPAAGDQGKFLRGDSTWAAVNAGTMSFTPAGSIAATTIQAAIEELDSEKQPLDATLTALAGLNSTAGLVEQTGADTFTKRLIGTTNATDILTKGGGDGLYQTLDATLTALSGLAWSAGTQVPVFTAADTVSFKTVGQAAGNILDKAAGDALYASLGHNHDAAYAALGHNHDATYQALDADLTAIAGLSGTSGFLKKTAADTWTLDTSSYSLNTHDHDEDYASIIHYHAIAGVTGLEAALDAKLDDSQATAFGLSLLDDADAAAGRSTLGLGTSATVNTGTSGATLPLLNGAATTWAAGSTWGGQIVATTYRSDSTNPSFTLRDTDTAGSSSTGSITWWNSDQETVAYITKFGDSSLVINNAVGNVALYTAGSVRALASSTGLAVTGALSATSTVSGVGFRDSGASLARFEGSGAGRPTSTGAGIDIYQGNIASYNTTSSAFSALDISASTLNLKSGSTTIGAITSTGLSITGEITASSDINISGATGTARNLRFQTSGSDVSYIALGGDNVTHFHNVPTGGGHKFQVNGTVVGEVNGSGLAVTGTTAISGNTEIGGGATTYRLGVTATDKTLALRSTSATFSSPALNFLQGTIDACVSPTASAFAVGTYSAHDVNIMRGNATVATFSNTGLNIATVGSAGTPSLRLTDANSGFYGADGVLSASINGTERFVLSGTGLSITGDMSCSGAAILGDATSDIHTVNGKINVTYNSSLGAVVASQGVVASFNSTNSNANLVELKTGGTIQAYWGATASNVFTASNASGDQRLVVAQNGSTTITTTAGYPLTADGVNTAKILFQDAATTRGGVGGSSTYCLAVMESGLVSIRMGVENDGDLAICTPTTTANAANLYHSGTNLNILSRSTSSVRYKTDIEDVDPAYAQAALGLRPVWYRSTASADSIENSYWGFIAEEVAEIDPRLVHFDEEGEPDGVQYERISVLQQVIIKEHEEKIAAQEEKIGKLESALEAMMARIEALESAKKA